MAQTIKLKRSGTQGAAPTTSNLALGEVAINTYDGKMYIKKSVGGTESIVEIGGSGSSSVSYLEAGMIEYEYTATSNQTTFSGSDSNSATLSYTANSIMVFLNGVLQDDGVDYTATNGTSVVFTSALTANDEVRIVAFTNVATTSSLQNPTKLDAITTVNGQAAYSLTVNSSAYTPSSQNALIVSLNGITQEPGDSFTISGSTITFSPALVTGDVVDYIVDMGRAVTIGEYDSDLVVTGDITPGADSTYDLGASGTEWANVYADTFTGNLTGNVTGTVSSLSNHDTDDLSEGSTNLYFTTAQVDSHLSGGTGVTYNAGEISIGQDVGTTATPTFGNITTTGYIAGPSTFTIDPAAVGDNTGTLVVAGNLQVDGTTTTINSTTMTVDDLNITLASGAANAAAANGAGITVDGASATLTYNSTPDAWSFNKNLGIGTASPSFLLHAYETPGNGAYSDTTNMEATARFHSTEATTGSYTAIQLAANNGNSALGWWNIGTVSTSTNYDNHLVFQTRTGSATYAERMRIDSSGNVGIGTASPARLLTMSSTGATLLSLVSTDDDNCQLLFGDSASDTIGKVLYRHADDRLTLQAGGTETLHVVGGDVGIGTTSPDEKLVVNGNLAFSYNTSISAYTIGKASDAYGIEYHSGVTSDSTKIAHTFSSSVNSNILSITYGGTVGIGVTNPTGATLEIQSNAGANALKLNARTNDDYSFIQFYDNAGTTLRGQIANHNGAINLYTGSSGTIRTHIDTAGNVGIGTASPTTNCKLHLADADVQMELEATGGSNSGFINFDGNSLQLSTNRNMKTGAFSNTGKSNATMMMRGVSGGSEFRFYTASANNTAATERMRINAAGNVVHEGGAFFHGEDAHDTASITGSGTITTTGITTSNSSFIPVANTGSTWIFTVRVHYNSGVYYHEAIGSCVMSGIFWNNAGDAWHDILLNHHNGSSIACQIQFSPGPSAGSPQELKIKTVSGSFAFTGGVYFTGVKLY